MLKIFSVACFTSDYQTLQSLSGQTCHGWINHDIVVVGLFVSGAEEIECVTVECKVRKVLIHQSQGLLPNVLIPGIWLAPWSSGWSRPHMIEIMWLPLYVMIFAIIFHPKNIRLILNRLQSLMVGRKNKTAKNCFQIGHYLSHLIILNYFILLNTFRRNNSSSLRCVFIPRHDCLTIGKL